MDVQQIAEKNGIQLRSTAHGTYRHICPKCSQNRKKKMDKCLSVRIDSSGIGWKCFNCGNTGGYGNAVGSSSKVFAKKVFGCRERNPYGDILRQARSRWHSNAG